MPAGRLTSPWLSTASRSVVRVPGGVRSHAAGSCIGIIVVPGLVAVPDLLALRADRVLLRVAAGYPHLAAQGDHGCAVDHRVRELVLGDVMREPFVTAVVGRRLRPTVLEGVRRRAETHVHLRVHASRFYALKVRSRHPPPVGGRATPRASGHSPNRPSQCCDRHHTTWVPYWLRNTVYRREGSCHAELILQSGRYTTSTAGSTESARAIGNCSAVLEPGCWRLRAWPCWWPVWASTGMPP